MSGSRATEVAVGRPDIPKEIPSFTHPLRPLFPSNFRFTSNFTGINGTSPNAGASTIRDLAGRARARARSIIIRHSDDAYRYTARGNITPAGANSGRYVASVARGIAD